MEKKEIQEYLADKMPVECAENLSTYSITQNLRGLDSRDEDDEKNRLLKIINKFGHQCASGDREQCEEIRDFLADFVICWPYSVFDEEEQKQIDFDNTNLNFLDNFFDLNYPDFFEIVLNGLKFEFAEVLRENFTVDYLDAKEWDELRQWIFASCRIVAEECRANPTPKFQKYLKEIEEFTKRWDKEAKNE